MAVSRTPLISASTAFDLCVYERERESMCVCEKARVNAWVCQCVRACVCCLSVSLLLAADTLG